MQAFLIFLYSHFVCLTKPDSPHPPCDSIIIYLEMHAVNIKELHSSQDAIVSKYT